MFIVRRGRLVYSPAPPTGCVLRRTPILAWALLELLERYPNLPDVAIPFNCRDKPTFWYPDGPQPRGSFEIATTATVRDGKPALVFSYTTGHTFSDVPLPDTTFWGLPYARIPPWKEWLGALDRPASRRWHQKVDKILWVGTTGVGNGKLGFSSHPLRARFAQCGPKVFGNRLEIRGIAKEDVDRLAWKCPPGGSCGMPPHWLPLQEQCRYRIILHLPGVSDWLEHYKHQLSCGSLNVYVTEERDPNRRDQRREAEVKAPLTPPGFEHFDWWGPLLQAGVHYVHIHVRRHQRSDLCHVLKTALAQLDADPDRARCIAERGRQLAKQLTMERVYEYMAGVLRGAAAIQRPEVSRRQATDHVVTKRNFLRHVSESTRPWIERIFLPALGVNVSRMTAAAASRPGAAFSFKR